MGCEFSTLLSGFRLVSLFYCCITTPLLSHIFSVSSAFSLSPFPIFFSLTIHFFFIFIHPRFLVIYIRILQAHRAHYVIQFISITNDWVFRIKKYIYMPDTLQIHRLKISRQKSNVEGEKNNNYNNDVLKLKCYKAWVTWVFKYYRPASRREII